MRHAYQVGNEEASDSSIIQHEPKESIRLNKYISSSGYCSRREADRFIENGKVLIDGVIAEVGTKVYDHQEVIVESFKIEPTRDLVYIALHKPIGITCTTDFDDYDNIVDFLDYPERVFPIGRLDKESSGLILMTNDGDIVNKVLRSVHQHEKEYIVTVNDIFDDEFIHHMREGVEIYNPVTNKYQLTKPCKITKLGPRTFRLILVEGLNRQIRRMCTVLGHRVVKLERIRVMNIKLGDMDVGAWRYITKEELIVLNNSMQHSATSENL